MAETEPAFTVESFTAGDGYTWRYRRYPPAGPTRGHVVCLHGIQSHAGWYSYSCTRVARAGWQVSFLDRRGSGMNDQDRGDTPNFRRLLDDIAEFLRSPALHAPGPRFLVAISWGGKLGVALQQRHPGLVDGLALLCPGLCPKVGAPFAERCRIAFSRLVAPRRKFPIPLIEPELFTDNPRWQEFIRNDPLSLREATTRLLIESFRVRAYLRLIVRPAAVPTLLMLAGRDRIIDNARTRRYVEWFATGERRIIEYPDAHHTLEFEPEPDRFVDDLLEWLDGRAQEGGRAACGEGGHAIN